MRWIAVLAGIGLLAGCFESKLRYCDNGAICPETLACTERTPTVCGDEDKVAPCKTMPDRTACSSQSTLVGTCASGVCSECSADYVECRFAEWKAMQSPTSQPLDALWVVADNDVYAAGAGPTVLHYDGTAWTALPPPPTAFAINGIWGSAAGDVVAVAQDGAVFRLVAGSWTTITPLPQVVLFAVWGTALDNLVVVGEMGTILRYDGTSWSPMTSNTTRILNAVWGTDSSNLVAVGAAGVIQRYNGSNWQAAPATPITGVTFRGAWMSPTKIFAGGSQTAGLVVVQQAAGWNTQPVSTQYIAGVWGTTDDDVYAVGAAGTIMHYDGVTWMPMTSPVQSALEAVAGTATNTFAVGAGGVILRYSP